MDKGTVKLLSILFLFLLIPAATSTVVVNSENWRDISVGIQYADYNEKDFRAVSTTQEGYLTSNVLSNEDHVTVLSSGFEKALSIDYADFLENQGVEETTKKEISWNISQYELYEQVSHKVDQMIVIRPDFGADFSAVYSYARQTDSWILFYDEEVIDFLEEEGKHTVFYGVFPERPWIELENVDYELYNHEDHYKNNMELTAEHISLTGSSTVKGLGERTITPGSLKGSSKPVLLLSDSEELVDFSFEHDIGLFEIVGPEHNTIGHNIRTDSNREIGVIVKTGRTFTGIEGLEGVEMPSNRILVPQRGSDVRIERAIHDPDTNNIYILYRNYGMTGARIDYLGADLVDAQGSIELVDGFEATMMIGPESTRSQKFRLDADGVPTAIDVTALADGSEIPYNESEGNLVQQTRIGNLSEPVIEDMKIDGFSRKLGLEVSNPGDETIYAGMLIEEIDVDGSTYELKSDREEIPPGETAFLQTSLRLDREEAEQLSPINATLVSGSERFDTSIKNVSENIYFEEEVSVGYLAALDTVEIVAIVILFIAIIAGIVYYKNI